MEAKTERKRDAVTRAEQSVSYGAPTCDICYGTDRDERHEDAEYWPDEPVSFLNADADAAVDFWNLTVCDHHTPRDAPVDATHYVKFETYNKEEHHMNSAVGRRAIEVIEL
jgi:hypothetical protein